MPAILSINSKDFSKGLTVKIGIQVLAGSRQQNVIDETIGIDLRENKQLNIIQKLAPTDNVPEILSGDLERKEYFSRLNDILFEGDLEALDILLEEG